MLRVVVLDNDRLIARALARQLRELCFVRVTATTAEAIAAVEEHSPHIVIADFNLDGETSGDFLAWLRATHPDVVRVLMSGSSPEVTEELLAAGLVSAALPKPWNSADVVQLLETTARHAAPRRTAGIAAC